MREASICAYTLIIYVIIIPWNKVIEPIDPLISISKVLILYDYSNIVRYEDWKRSLDTSLREYKIWRHS